MINPQGSRTAVQCYLVYWYSAEGSLIAKLSHDSLELRGWLVSELGQFYMYKYVHYRVALYKCHCEIRQNLHCVQQVTLVSCPAIHTLRQKTSGGLI